MLNKELMEGFHSNNNPRILKINGINGNVSPISAQIDNQFEIRGGRYHQSKSPSFDSHSSNNLDNMDSPLIRFLRSGSPAARIIQSAGSDGFTAPAIDAAKYRQMIGHHYSNSNNSNFGSRVLSPMENLEKSSPSPRSPPVFAKPVKVEEDVLVMDGILMGSVPGGRMRSASDSGGSSSSSSSGNSLYKTDICRSWEDSGCCRYGSKCQFAHGKEELRPTRFLTKNKVEVQMCKSYATTGSCAYGTRCRFDHQAMMVAAVVTEVAAAAGTTYTASLPIGPEHAISAADVATAAADTTYTASSPIEPEHASSSSREYSPLDDGIEVVLPSSSVAREDVDAYIRGVLYGPTPRKRLPVFAEICP